MHYPSYHQHQKEYTFFYTTFVQKKLEFPRKLLSPQKKKYPNVLQTQIKIKIVNILCTEISKSTELCKSWEEKSWKGKPASFSFPISHSPMAKKRSQCTLYIFLYCVWNCIKFTSSSGLYFPDSRVLHKLTFLKHIYKCIWDFTLWEQIKDIWEKSDKIE